MNTSALRHFVIVAGAVTLLSACGGKMATHAVPDSTPPTAPIPSKPAAGLPSADCVTADPTLPQSHISLVQTGPSTVQMTLIKFFSVTPPVGSPAAERTATLSAFVSGAACAPDSIQRFPIGWVVLQPGRTEQPAVVFEVCNLSQTSMYIANSGGDLPTLLTLGRAQKLTCKLNPAL